VGRRSTSVGRETPCDLYHELLSTMALTGPRVFRVTERSRVSGRASELYLFGCLTVAVSAALAPVMALCWIYAVDHCKTSHVYGTASIVPRQQRQTTRALCRRHEPDHAVRSCWERQR